MHAPVDYPLTNDSEREKFSGCELAYAVHLDRISEKEVFAQRALQAEPIVADLPHSDPKPKSLTSRKVTSKSFSNLAHSLLSQGFSARMTHRSGVFSAVSRSSR
jgi:hypothetical protein